MQNGFRNWLENYEQRLGDFIEARTNFPEADFWVVRKGTEKEVGKPTKEFHRERIGIKVKNENLLPNYLFYALEHLYTQGYFRQFATGTTRLVNIRVNDILNIQIGG